MKFARFLGVAAAWLSLGAAGCMGQAVGDNELDSTESAVALSPTYQDDFDNIMMPYCRSTGVQTFDGKDNVKIAYTVYPSNTEKERGAIVFVPGRSDPFYQYCETFYDLRNSGYTIYAMDVRGQGLSGRLLEDPQKGFVKHFGDYVTDLETFVDTIVKQSPHEKLYLLAHSTGGAIGTRYLVKHQDTFNAAVFTSPLWKLNTGNIPEPVAYTMVTGSIAIGKGADYGPGQGHYDPSSVDPATASWSRSAERVQATNRMLLSQPELILGGPTNRWIHEVIGTTWAVQWDAKKLTTPILVLQAGQDSFVRTEAHQKVCSAAKDCRVITYPDAFHFLFIEKDEVRGPAIQSTVEFMNAH